MTQKKGYILKWGNTQTPTNDPATEEETPTKEETTEMLSTSLEFLSWLAEKDEARFKLLFILFQLETMAHEN